MDDGGIPHRGRDARPSSSERAVEQLYGGRDPDKLKHLIPLTPDAFVLEGSLGEWIFVVDEDLKAVRILNFRKFEPLVWARIGDRK
jgi:hypothetical protein